MKYNHWLVTVIIPTLNEESFIGEILQNLKSQAVDQVIEIIVVDGGSTDRTRLIVEAAGTEDSRIRLLDNPDRWQAAGVNKAVLHAHPDANILVRVDAHARYPADYIRRLIDTLVETDADSVVVRMRSLGGTVFQRAVAAASNSRLGTGGAAHRVGRRSGFVKHGHHAAFWKDVFLRTGGYDERFRTNEDAEFDARLRRGGGRIWLAANIVIDYYTRRTPWQLACQYYLYGRGRCQTMCKLGEQLAMRQVAPGLLVACLGLSTASAVVTPWALTVPAAYIGGLGLGACYLVLKNRMLCAALTFVVLPIMHLSWGLGFSKQLLESRPPATIFARQGRPQF